MADNRAACRLCAHPARVASCSGECGRDSGKAIPRGDPEVVALERGPLAWSTGESGQQRKEIPTPLEKVPGDRKAR